MTDLKRYRMFIDGRWVDAEDGKTFESVNPANGRPWAVFPSATAKDTDRAVKAAHRAFEEGPWAKLTPTERGKLLRRLAALMPAASEELGRIETIDTGKLFKETRWQANRLAESYEFYAGLADKVHGETLPIDKPDVFVCTVREPLGVIAAVVPWNSQLSLTAVKMGPALAAGNTIVIKASEHASAAVLEFAKLVEAAGFPPGVVNVLTGFGEPCGRALTTHPLVARISFTGGLTAARQVVQNSAENLAQVSLELGGKSPVLVFEDADLDSATSGVLTGIFGASGQSCVAGSRLYLQEKIADKLLTKLLDQAKAIRIGDPLADDTQMGPLATEGQRTRIEAAVETATREGATVLHRRQAAAPVQRRLVLRADRRRLPGTAPADRRYRAVRAGAERAALQGRGGRGSARQRHAVRARLRRLHQGCRPRHAGGEADPLGHRLGQHLSHGVRARPVWRLQEQRLRARGRLPVDLRLHPAEDDLGQQLDRAGRQSLRHALNDAEPAEPERSRPPAAPRGPPARSLTAPPIAPVLDPRVNGAIPQIRGGSSPVEHGSAPSAVMPR